MHEYLVKYGYIWDDDFRIWKKKDYQGIPYSDGLDVEENLLNIVRSASDVSVFSSELKASCKDWVSTYHFSPSRGNVLYPFSPELKDKSVLEIGAGCGAITRALGEWGAKVLALEGSPKRASIARSRTRDLQDIDVVTDNFSTFDVEKKFDYVTLIGVLEYASVFMSGEAPALAMLQKARQFLKPHGVLVIAIENKYGLKYFAGANEDHLGKPMIGIEDRYTIDGPRTYGKVDLQNLLTQAGLNLLNLFGSFPDYKMPVNILSENCVAKYPSLAGALSAQGCTQDRQMPDFPIFRQQLAWQGLANNDLTLDLANSFIALAGASVNQQISPSNDLNKAIAWHFSSERRVEFSKVKIFHDKDDHVWIEESRLNATSFPDVKVSCSQEKSSLEVSQSIGGSLFLEGQIIQDKIQHLFSDKWHIDSFVPILKLHYDTILRSSLVATSASNDLQQSLNIVVEPKLLDAGFSNLLIDSTGLGHFIDLEWEMNAPLTIRHLMIRSWIWGIHNSRESIVSNNTIISRGRFIMELFKSAGLTITEAEVRDAIYLEHNCQCIINKVNRIPELELWFDTELHGIDARSKSLDFQYLKKFSGYPASTPILDLFAIEQSVIKQDQIISNHINTNDKFAIEFDRINGINSSLSNKVQELTNQIDLLRQSSSWRITHPLRRVKTAVYLWSLAKRQYGGFLPATSAILGYGIKGGWRHALAHLRKLADRTPDTPSPVLTHQQASNAASVTKTLSYLEWAHQFDITDIDIRDKAIRHIQSMESPPTFSIIVPTYKAKPQWLAQAIESIRQQIYPFWDLCIADDASNDSVNRELLTAYQASSSQIKVFFRAENGHISNASNSALSLATSEWAVLLDHDDILAPDALYQLACAALKNPNAQIMFSDEDKIDEFGVRHGAYLKSDWNRYLFYSHNMVSHLGAYRLSLLREIGGFRPGFEGSQDYDLALRCIERSTDSQIVHIPRVLYHWRVHAESTAAGIGAKPYAVTAAENALTEHFQRTGSVAKVTSTPAGYHTKFKPTQKEVPYVTMLLVPHDNMTLDLIEFENWLTALLKLTPYSHLQVIACGNFHLPESISAKVGKHFEWVNSTEYRNLKDLLSHTITLVKGEQVAVLEHGILPIQADWLENLVGLLARQDTAVVAPKVMTCDNRSAEQVMVLTSSPSCPWMFAFSGLDQQAPGYMSRAQLMQTATALSGPCWAVKTRHLAEVLPQTSAVPDKDLWMVDLCLHLGARGLNNVWYPLVHLRYEANLASVSNTLSMQGQMRLLQLQAAYSKVFERDPSYSHQFKLMEPLFENLRSLN